MVIWKKRLVDFFWIAAAFLIVFQITTDYSTSYIGKTLKVAFGDSWIFADLAKRFAFRQSLRMEVFDIVYPPLYSLLLAFSYLKQKPDEIFRAIRMTNIAVYSLTVVPLFLLFRDYARLAKGWALAFAVVVALAPTTLHYTGWLLSEPLYIPLVAFLFYFVFREVYLRSLPAAFVFGLYLALLPLCKTVGYSFVLAFGAFGFWQIVIQRQREQLPKFAMVLVGLLLPLLAYKFYLSAVLPAKTGGVSGYLPNLEFPILLSPLYWLDRTSHLMAYLLYAPLTIAGFFVVALGVQDRRWLWQDPWIVFWLIVVLVHLLIIPPFTPYDPANVYHSRYLMPFVFVESAIFLRYRDRLDRKMLKYLLALVLVFSVAKLPCRLMPFAGAMSDGLYCPKIDGRVIGALSNNLLFTIVLFLPPLAFVYARRYALGVLLAAMLSLYQFGNVSQIEIGVPDFFVKNYMRTGLGDLTRLASEKLSADKKLRLVVDRRWRQGPVWVEIAAALWAIPAVPDFADRDQVSADLPRSTLFLTPTPLPKHNAVARTEDLWLYQF